MARRSKKQKMKAASTFFFLLVIGLVGAAIAALRHDDDLIGTELIGWALLPLAVVFGFTLHTTCGVTTTRRTPCTRDSYGFLFGCTGNGHWLKKFRFRLGFRNSEPPQVQRRQSNSLQVVMYQPAPQAQQPMKVAVEENARSICAFWIALISAVAGIIQVIVTFAH
jgi:hypothetical protein